MSSKQSRAAGEAVASNRALATEAYGVAIPALQGRQDEINRALAAGEPGYMTSAFEGQRGALTEGLAARAGMAQAQQARGSKAALSGGNAFAGMNPADLGAQLANALYGSKFAQGQANIDQQFNLLGMALGGAGTAGSGALQAAQGQIQNIGYMPPYNPLYAGIVGGAAGLSSIYGAANQAGLFGSGGNLLNVGFTGNTPMLSAGFTGNP